MKALNILERCFFKKYYLFRTMGCKISTPYTPKCEVEGNKPFTAKCFSGFKDAKNIPLV